ncbi:MAG TPA: DUF1707 domain-containing protein [Kineosporiaceae bacterium]
MRFASAAEIVRQALVGVNGGRRGPRLAATTLTRARVALRRVDCLRNERVPATDGATSTRPTSVKPRTGGGPSSSVPGGPADRLLVRDSFASYPADWLMDAAAEFRHPWPSGQDRRMSEHGGGWPGQEAYRIGDAERAAATEALNAHREAGRLDATEYEDRQVQVSRARTWAEIRPVFADLPQPHPAGMPDAGPTPGDAPSASLPGVPESLPTQQSVPSQGLLRSVVPDRYRATVMALTPFAALLLFLVTRDWIWFLAIPVMGILLYGAEGDHERRRQRDIERAERRRMQRERRRRY